MYFPCERMEGEIVSSNVEDSVSSCGCSVGVDVAG